jgi:hypothetical protein
MATTRRLSGQHTISTTDSAELAVDASEISADTVRILNEGSNPVHVGNDGGDAVDDTTGYNLDAGESVAVRIDHRTKGHRADLYVYGPSGAKLSFVAIS